MSRRKKDGCRATGIQSKNGKLYIVLCHTVIEDGVKKAKKEWRATGLEDTPDNIKKALFLRESLVCHNKPILIDRNIPLKEFIDIFLEKKKREIANTTYSAYLGRAKHIKDYFGETRVIDIKQRDIEGFLDSLFTHKECQPRTVKDTKVFLSMVLENAVEENLIPSNPASEVVISKQLASKYKKERSSDESFFSYDEAISFLKIVEQHELYGLFYFTLIFGLRREEVLGLKWNCIDWTKKTLTIQHTVTKGTEINRLNTTKTESSFRTYPLDDSQINFLLQIKDTESVNRKLFGKQYNSNDYIFKHIDGTLYYPDYPSKAFKKIIKAHPDVLPQGVHFHGLRTSCVSILVYKGFDVKSIQKWVGHADIETTLKIYAQVKERESKENISSSISNLFEIKA